MFKCKLCKKDFESKYKLTRHENRKTPCVKEEKKLNCKICNVKFRYNIEKTRHEKTTKHIKNLTIHGNNNNINIQNGDHNTINNIMNLTLNMTPFSNSRLDFIDAGFIGYLDYIYKFSCIEDKEYGIMSALDLTIEAMIDLLEKVNFNLSFSENHNCKILLVIPNTNKNLYEYLILEINPNNKLYQWKNVNYNEFLEEIYKMMVRISEEDKIKFTIENIKFKKYIDFINKNLLLNEKNKERFKNKIQNKLHQIYDKIKDKRINNTKLNLTERIDEYKNFRKEECRLNNGYEPDIVNSII